jgi:hypothetical protein
LSGAERGSRRGPELEAQLRGEPCGDPGYSGRFHFSVLLSALFCSAFDLLPFRGSLTLAGCFGLDFNFL